MSGHTYHTPAALRSLSDDALLTRLDALVGQERESLVDILEHLGEVDRREVALDKGYPSLFVYCVRRLGYSEGAAFLRIRAARAAGDYPEILKRLRSGRLHLDAVARLYPHLTAENSRVILDKADGASKREVLSMVATFQTEPNPARDLIVPLPSLAPSSGVDGAERCSGAASSAEAPLRPFAVDDSAPQVVPPPQHRFHFTGDEELFAMVERLRALLRHKNPHGRLEVLFKEAARSLLEKLDAQRRPLRHPGKGLRAYRVARAVRQGSRHIPRTIKRAVWIRDEGRCTYISPDGRRCDSRDAIEYDHIVPWADGGRSDTADNIRLLCRPHNQRLGRRRFGTRRRA